MLPLQGCKWVAGDYGGSGNSNFCLRHCPWSERCGWPFWNFFSKNLSTSSGPVSVLGKWGFDFELKPCVSFQGSTASVASILRDSLWCNKELYVHSCSLPISPCKTSLFFSLSLCLSASEQLLHSVDFTLVLFGWMWSKVTSAAKCFRADSQTS